jgi:predicted dehydrogenase
MPESSRRQFLGASVAAMTAASYSRVLGANGRIRMGAIGTGGRGKYLMQELNKIGGIEWAAVCDVYNVRRDEAATIAGGPVKSYNDHRQLLDLKDVEAVVIATPDHWHAAIGIDACNAGKDIYVEKPMVHFPNAGQALVEAVRRNRRICQVGMQARAIPHFQRARERYVESGVMGKVGLVRTWYDANSGYILKAPPGMRQKPEGLDWDRWLGPGPKVSWNPEIYFSPYKWLHYDGGMVMGIGIHVIDSAHQFLKLTRPKAAVAAGGIYFYKDGRDTPDVVNIILEYPQELNVTFEAEILTAPGIPSNAGIELKGAGGALTVLRYNRDLGYQYRPNSRYSDKPAEQIPGDPASAEWLIRNWLDSIRTRQKPIAGEEQGYWSSVACFMGAQALRTQSRVVWNDAWNLPA